MGGLFGGGGGGSPPTAPKLKMVDTSLTGPLYTQSAKIGDQWANLMRGSYGLGQSTGPASWEAKYLGPGALAMMKQAGIPFAGAQDPQVTGTLTKAFGAPGVGQAGTSGGQWNLGGDPFTMGQQLGQQFKSPLAELQRNQGFETQLLKQWQPPNLRLTGTDLLNVKMGNMTAAAQAQQQAFQQALGESNIAAQAQGAQQQAAAMALGKVGAAGINAFGNYFSQPSPSGGYIAPTSTSGAMDAYNPSYNYGGGGGTSFFGSPGGA